MATFEVLGKITNNVAKQSQKGKGYSVLTVFETDNFDSYNEALFEILAFGKAHEVATKLKSDQLVKVLGTVTSSTYEDKNKKTRIGLSLKADIIQPQKSEAPVASDSAQDIDSIPF